MPILTEGDEEAAAVAEEIKASRPKRFRIKQLVIKAGDDILIRFVTDRRARQLVSGKGTMPGWISADTHGFIPTKPQPEEYTGQKWPDKMWAICMRDRMFRLRGADGKPTDEFEDGYGDCYIHNTYQGVKEGKFNRDLGLPDAQVYSLAVLREPVLDASSKNVIGFKDQMAEWTDDKGNVLQVPHFVIVNQKYPNFYAAVAAACYVEPATATNKDFRIKRVENEYHITPVNQTADFMHGLPAWQQAYEAPLTAMGFDLRAHILDHASQDHYNRWFIPGAVPKDGYARKDKDGAESAPDAGAQAPAAAAAAAPQIDAAAMADFRDSLQKRG